MPAADSVLNVGIIGAGRISDLHAIEYLANPGARIVAVCDSDLATARMRAAQWGVTSDRVFGRWQDLLAVGEIDLVEVLLPHDLHAPVSIAALHAGKHVSVQKPMATTLEDADRMIRAAELSGMTLRVFENALFFPPLCKARELVEAGAIGQPLSIRIKANKADPRLAWAVPEAARTWRQDAARSGGGSLTFGDGHHKFAVAWHFMGKPVAVHAWIGRTEVQPGFVLDCPAQISWQFEGQRFGNLEVVYSPELQVHTHQYAQHDPVEITGTKGVIQVTCGHARLADQPPVLLFRNGRIETFPELDSRWESSFVAATRHHILALQGRRPLMLSAEQGREILKFCLAAQASAQLGRSVAID